MKKKLIILVVSMLAVLSISVGVFANWSSAGFRTVKRYNTTTGYTFFVQRICHRKYSTTVDGVWGAKTTADVKSAQTFCGVTADGIVGPASWTAFRSNMVSFAYDGAGNRVYFGWPCDEGDIYRICELRTNGSWYTYNQTGGLYQFK